MSQGSPDEGRSEKECREMFASSRKTPQTSQPGRVPPLSFPVTGLIVWLPHLTVNPTKAGPALGHSSVLSAQHRAWHSRWTRGSCSVKPPMRKEPEAPSSSEGSTQPVLEAL